MCVTGTGGGRPPAAVDRRGRGAAESGNIGGTSARLYGEDDERKLLLLPPPPPRLPPLVSLRLRRLPELLYPE